MLAPKAQPSLIGTGNCDDAASCSFGWHTLVSPTRSLCSGCCPAVITTRTRRSSRYAISSACCSASSAGSRSGSSRPTGRCWPLCCARCPGRRCGACGCWYIPIRSCAGWEILREADIDPAPDRTATTWADFLRSQANALLAADFIETVTLTGARLYILAVIEHTSRRIRILGATAHPTAAWVAQVARNLVMDLQDVESTARYLIRDRDGKYPELFDAVLADTGITVVRSGVQIAEIRGVLQRTPAAPRPR